VKRKRCRNGFEVLPKRWIVERTFACAMIRIMLRRLVANPSS
jgi:transposase